MLENVGLNLTVQPQIVIFTALTLAVAVCVPQDAATSS